MLSTLPEGITQLDINAVKRDNIFITVAGQLVLDGNTKALEQLRQCGLGVM